MEDYINPDIASHNKFINEENSENVNLQQGNYNFMKNNDLNPENLEELITSLKINASKSENDNLNKIINTLRQELNEQNLKKIYSIFNGLKNTKGTTDKVHIIV